MEQTCHSVRSFLPALMIMTVVSLVPHQCHANWMATCVPESAGSEYGTVFGAVYSKTGYDTLGRETAVTRYTIGGAVSSATPLDWLDVYLGASYILKASPTRWPGDGYGFMFAGGAKAGDWPVGSLRLTTYGHVQYTDESYGSAYLEKTDETGNIVAASGVKLDSSSIEAIVGINALLPVNDTIDLYASIDVYVLKDGELATSMPLDTSKPGWERSDFADMAMGAAFRIGDWKLHAEANLVGENAIIIAASVML